MKIWKQHMKNLINCSVTVFWEVSLRGHSVRYASSSGYQPCKLMWRDRAGPWRTWSSALRATVQQFPSVWELLREWGGKGLALVKYVVGFTHFIFTAERWEIDKKCFEITDPKLKTDSLNSRLALFCSCKC